MAQAEAPSPGHCTAPRSADAHLIDTGNGFVLFDAEAVQLRTVDQALAGTLDQCLAQGDAGRLAAFAAASGLLNDPPPVSPVPEHVPVKTISLAIAQKCNLGCTYCYAQEGGFGATPENMTSAVARRAIDRLIEGLSSGQRATLVFLGGEPLANRAGFRGATRYAAKKAGAAGVEIDFAITTNATLIRPDDAEFFDAFGFTVTISIDGIGSKHDALRPFKSGRGSYTRAMTGASLLLDRAERRTPVFARVTVTPDNLDLEETLTGLVDAGFDSVQFAPTLSSPTGRGVMDGGTLMTLLDRMIACGEMVESRLQAGSVISFANMTGALRRIHEGSRDAYPCGAGGGYLGVSAEGGYFACHRFVNDESGSMGDVENGPDDAARNRWMTQRHVSQQTPCTTCWARRLCGGSCHYEVIKAGRPACDYIRGWLHYCLGAYARLATNRPQDLSRVIDGPRRTVR